MQIPTLGRIVHFVLPDSHPSKGEIRAAIITYVYPQNMVDLQPFMRPMEQMVHPSNLMCIPINPNGGKGSWNWPEMKQAPATLDGPHPVGPDELIARLRVTESALAAAEAFLLAQGYGLRENGKWEVVGHSGSLREVADKESPFPPDHYPDGEKIPGREETAFMVTMQAAFYPHFEESLKAMGFTYTPAGGWRRTFQEPL